MDCNNCKYKQMLDASRRSEHEYKEMWQAALKRVCELQDKVKELLSKPQV